MELHEGGCLCGALRYRTTSGKPGVYVCHCGFCKRLTGSAFLLEAIFARSEFEYIGGMPSVFEYKSPVHGRTIAIEFCPTCTTKIGMRLERFPTRYAVIGGTFDDPAWLKPAHHLFTEAALPWIRYPEDVNCFRKHIITEDGAAEVPWRSKLGSA